MKNGLSSRQQQLQVIMYNGNWTEWSAIWSEIIRVISKSNECAARVRFEIQTKIAQHEVQLPLYYIHFEIAEFSQY